MSTPIETNTEELRDILNQVNNLPDRSGGSGGVELPTLDNPGAAEDLILGKELIGADGEKVVGTMFLAEDGMFLEGFATAEESAYQGKPVISISNPFAQRIAFDKGSGVKMHVLCENFGDASESDVVSGKTFTSKDGLTKPGSMPLVTDTTGNIVISPINTLKHVMAGNNVIRNVVEVPERVAFEANSRFAIDTRFKQLPNVEPNLKAENIKKDVSIFDFVGTYEGTGDVELPTLDNPGMPEHVMEGKEYIDQNGVKQTGEFTLDAELTEQDSLISQIMTALGGKTASGSVKETTTVNFECSGAIRVDYINADGELVTLNTPNGVYDNIPVNQMLATRCMSGYITNRKHSGNVESVYENTTMELLYLYGECTLICTSVSEGGSDD